MTKDVRKQIPPAVKIAVTARQEGRCAHCGERLTGDTEYDHRPPLMNRPIDPDTGGTIPPANDPAAIDALHEKCHAVRTFGPGGERRITTRGGDLGEKARERGLQSSHGEHLERMANKLPGQPRQRSGKWQRRPMKTGLATALLEGQRDLNRSTKKEGDRE